MDELTPLLRPVLHARAWPPIGQRVGSGVLLNLYNFCFHLTTTDSWCQQTQPGKMPWLRASLRLPLSRVSSCCVSPSLQGGTHGGRALADPFDWFFCFVFETVAKTDFENSRKQFFFFLFFCFCFAVAKNIRVFSSFFFRALFFVAKASNRNHR